MEAAPRVEHVVEAIRSLYHDPDPKRKLEASKWLNQLQRSVYALVREEVGLEVERLVSRVEAVQVRVATVRTAGQQEAVEKVEMEVRGLVARLQGGGEVELLVRECRGMLAACGGEEGGVRSEGFERLVLGCSASDQKLVRRRLEVLLEQMVALQGV